MVVGKRKWFLFAMVFAAHLVRKEEPACFCVWREDLVVVSLVAEFLYPQLL